MNIAERVNEIKSQISAFNKDTYTKSELLPELLKLQKEIVDLTFNSQHAEKGNLRLWDVVEHMKKLNDERNGAADTLLEKFIQSSKSVGNKIAAEISGKYGEQKVFRALENLGCENAVLRNVELEFDGKRTEIDAIVFTNKAIFIVEIKNSKKNIFIDEQGGFYRIGNCMHYDGNIAEKMDEREHLLRIALERAGVERPKIFKVITFTNPYIDVECKYHYIKTCPFNYLPVFIEKFTSSQWYSYESICTMMAAVNEMKCADPYQMPVDMNEYKAIYANLVATLEAAEEPDSVETTIQVETPPPIVANNNPKSKGKLILNILGKGVEVASIAFAALSLFNFGLGKIKK
ncbi:nuclease-related domain-containing protein [Ruminococcus sp. FC2018]|uniref:nuclease-related domain-containing protein n=1 Tax=Ruminococcus sp. FC2018 TaxID=1410617 RepID=UPI0004911259|nr:nuclease-related domain-containing protein [Ruminococcus sp. FC2018]